MPAVSSTHAPPPSAAQLHEWRAPQGRTASPRDDASASAQTTSASDAHGIVTSGVELREPEASRSGRAGAHASRCGPKSEAGSTHAPWRDERSSALSSARSATASCASTAHGHERRPSDSSAAPPELEGSACASRAMWPRASSRAWSADGMRASRSAMRTHMLGA
eukprot:516937-Prymnesium_polylepis.1